MIFLAGFAAGFLFTVSALAFGLRCLAADEAEAARKHPITKTPDFNGAESNSAHLHDKRPIT